VTVNPAGGSTWYARALDALSGRDATLERQRETAGDKQGEPAVSLDDVASPRAQRNLERAATSLGMDPATLLAHVTSGQDVRALLSRTSDAGYGTPIAKSTIGGIAIDQYA
jgi:hypothetical protein